MCSLCVTVIGQDLFKIVAEKFALVDLNPVNQVNTGMFGNLKATTYKYEFDSEDEVIEKRKAFLNECAKDSLRLQAMYVHGDWMRIFVIKPYKI